MDVPADGRQVWKVKSQSRYSLEIGIFDEEKSPKGIGVASIFAQLNREIDWKSSSNGRQVWKVEPQTRDLVFIFNAAGI